MPCRPTRSCRAPCILRDIWARRRGNSAPGNSKRSRASSIGWLMRIDNAHNSFTTVVVKNLCDWRVLLGVVLGAGADLAGEHVRDGAGGGVGGFEGDARCECVDALQKVFRRGRRRGFSFVGGSGVKLGKKGAEVGGERFVTRRAAELQGVFKPRFGESAGGAGDGQGGHRRARGVVSGFSRSRANQAVAAWGSSQGRVPGSLAIWCQQAVR